MWCQDHLSRLSDMMLRSRPRNRKSNIPTSRRDPLCSHPKIESVDHNGVKLQPEIARNSSIPVMVESSQTSTKAQPESMITKSRLASLESHKPKPAGKPTSPPKVKNMDKEVVFDVSSKQIAYQDEIPKLPKAEQEVTNKVFMHSTQSTCPLALGMVPTESQPMKSACFTESKVNQSKKTPQLSDDRYAGTDITLIGSVPTEILIWGHGAQVGQRTLGPVFLPQKPMVKIWSFCLPKDIFNKLLE